MAQISRKLNNLLRQITFHPRIRYCDHLQVILRRKHLLYEDIANLSVLTLTHT